MMRRATLVLLAAAALTPLAQGTAHASCLDDANSGLSAGYYNSPKSQYWSTNYVQRSGTATVTVQGDALVADYTAYAGDWVRYTQTVSGNAPDVATAFVDCVAG
jgi:gamma-glutamylcysteine synthetase